MNDILSVGVGVGLLTSAWCIATGGSLGFALLAYSVGGSSATLTAAIFVAATAQDTQRNA